MTMELNIAQAKSADSSNAPSLEVIVVTATKRQEQLIDVPIAITALGAKQLELAGTSNIRQLTAQAASVHFLMPSGGSDSSMRIRGIGTTSSNPGLESSVGVVIDGVPRARTGIALTELGDLERIEVLRGPQGTLFGRNTSAGLINVVTKEPHFRGVEGRLEGTAGNYGNLRTAGAFNAPLSEAVAMRIEASVERRDGLYEDQNGGTALDDIDRHFIRAKLRWIPHENLSWLFSGDYIRRDENCCVAVLAHAGATYDTINTLAGTRGELGYTSTDPFDRETVVSRGRIDQEDVVDWGFSAQGDLELGWGQLTSITAFRGWEAWRAQDFDFSGADLGYLAPNGLHQHFDVFTQELRLHGKSGSLDWLVGTFFSSEDVLYDSTFRMGADFPAFFGGAATFQPATLAAFTPGDGARGIGKQRGTDLSVFTHNIYSLTDRLSIRAGLRLTKNKKDIDYSGENFNPACDSAVTASDTSGIALFCAPLWDSRLNPAGDRDSRTENAASGTFNITYALAANMHGYVSYSRGYKSGGYNFDRFGFTTPSTPDAHDLAFRKETVDAYETGIKTLLLDGSLTANFAVFREEFQGFQFIESTGTHFVVRSLDKAITEGAELEVAWQATSGLELTGGISYTDAYYPTSAGNLGFSGEDMDQSPDWVAVTSATWEFPLGQRLKGILYFDNRYSSTFFIGGSDPESIQGDFSVANARLSIQSADNDWSVDLWSKNLFDADYYRGAFPATFQAGSYSAFLGEPRTYGVTARRNF